MDLVGGGGETECEVRKEEGNEVHDGLHGSDRFLFETFMEGGSIEKD